MNSKIISNPEWGLEAYRLCDVFSKRLLQNAIYHYTSMQNLPSILGKNGLTLWFTDHRYLNDKLEGKYHLSVIRSVAERLLENKAISKETHNFIASFAPQNVYTINIEENCLGTQACDTYICCFSLSSDSLPMWNYYSKGCYNEGCNLELYTVDTLQQQLQRRYGIQCKMISVIYSRTEQERIVQKALEFMETAPTQQDRDNFFMHFVSQTSFGFKQPACSHEEEVRLILHRPVNSTRTDQYYLERKFRWSHGMFIPYVEVTIPQLVKLRTLTLGPLANTDRTEESAKMLLSDLGYGKTKISNSSIQMRF